uniref:RING-type domain-containing protein n=1 Tax=Nelumbo nucifera TaxID=4432 RepID=A0A822Y5E1_NELNU|nr:TPA_asm: hypothetical protein HUJ06_026292 [Nelumbo nucifera]
MLPPVDSPFSFATPAATSSFNGVFTFTALCFLLFGYFIAFYFMVNITCSLYRKCMEMRMSNQRRRGHRPDPSLPLSVRSHPTVDVGDGEDSSSECAICLDALTEDSRCRVLPGCNHRFHTSCIDSWLSRSNSCPVCRLQLPPRPQIHIILNC